MAWDKARTGKWLVISLVVTVAGTALLWAVFGPGALFGFLFLPFLPFAFGGGRAGRGAQEREQVHTRRTCPRCGYVAADAEDRYCPRDGSPLV